MESLGTIAVVGNPNTGKTTLFNALTGLHQRIGNYPGVTVEKKLGYFIVENQEITLVDLPGTYSLSAHSLDERVVVDTLSGSYEGVEKIDGILVIADASNLQRNLYLFSQLVELKLPIVLALNMIDVAERNQIKIQKELLASRLKVPVIFVQAKSGLGLEELKKNLALLLKKEIPSPAYTETEAFIPPYQTSLTRLNEILLTTTPPTSIHSFQIERLLIDKGGYYEKHFGVKLGETFLKELGRLREALENGHPLSALEAEYRYQWVRKKLEDVLECPPEPPPSFSEKLDAVLTHRVFGLFIFLGMMVLLFQSIYSWSGPLMDLIDGTFGSLGELVGSYLPEGALKSLIVDGMIAGVGAVLIFLPQILILFLFLAILEDCGYMARAAFLMDKVMSKFGLSGKSFIPMLSSFACAIPGIMATRVIENYKDRLTTILVAPLMSCSARLPVYTILIAAFIPSTTLFGIFNLQGLVLFAAYALGVIVAVGMAWLLKKTVFKGENSIFVMELPSYKLPSFRTILMRIYEAGVEFIRRAGTIIFAITLIIWALAYYPRSTEIEEDFAQKQQKVEDRYEKQLNEWAKESGLATDRTQLFEDKAFTLSFQTYQEKRNALQSLKDEEAEAESIQKAEQELAQTLAKIQEKNQVLATFVLKIYEAEKQKEDEVASLENQKLGSLLENSFLARMGKTVQPIFAPLGWDWKISTATIASFPAREVIVATLGTIYSLGAEEDESSSSLRETLKSSRDPNGKLVFNIPVALSIMVFFALCAQCGATLAVIKRETHSWQWPLFTFTYMTLLAYIGGLLTYQIGMLF